MMNCAFVVQTCDKYERAWEGFLYFMKRHWDFNIEIPMFFCNEEKNIDLPKPFIQLKTGNGTFVQNLNNIIEKIDQEYIFYMQEDFWPTGPMKKDLFVQAFDVFSKNNFDALQISSFTPWYKLKASNHVLDGQRLLQFLPESEWIFNFQARFWKKESFKKCLVEPKVSESIVSSAITVEMDSDEFARKNFNLNCLLYHYLWYPLSGTLYRGKYTEIGEQMLNVINIDRFVAKTFGKESVKTSQVTKEMNENEFLDKKIELSKQV